MPIIKSAKKRVKQAAKRQARNYNMRNALKKSVRNIKEAVETGKKAEAQKLLNATYKVIDTADKKNIIPSNTAARKKASLAKLVSEMDENKKADAKAPQKKAKKSSSDSVKKEKTTSSKKPENKKKEVSEKI